MYPISQALAFPAGWLADRWRRDAVVSLSAILGLASTFTMLTWLRSDSTDQRLLFISMVMFGGYRGMLAGPLEAIFTDVSVDFCIRS